MIEVHRLHLADVTPAPHLPWARPTFPVFAYLVLHPAGPILVDSGVGVGNPFIDELYSPVHYDLDEALRDHGIRVDDIETVITSHLHFDHCGQNNRFPHAKVFVQRAEVEAAKAELYTVPEWAFPPKVELTIVEGDHDVVTGVRAIATHRGTHLDTSRWSSTMTMTGSAPSCAAKLPGRRAASTRSASAMMAGTTPRALHLSRSSGPSVPAACCSATTPRHGGHSETSARGHGTGVRSRDAIA